MAHLATAAGYGNLPNQYFVPEIFSTNVLLGLRRTLVADQITTTEYAGEIKNFGDTVNILREPDVTVTPYTRGGGTGTPQDLLDGRTVLSIDKANKYIFRLTDIDERNSNVNLMAMAADRAAYSLQNAYDAEVLAYINSSTVAANQLGALNIGFGAGNTTPLDLLGLLALKLDEANCPADNRYVVVPPKFMTWLFKEDGKYIEAQVLGTDKSAALQPAIAQTPHGFKIYKSNNLASGVIFAGHKDAVASAQTILKAEELRDTTEFGNLYRGLHVYGRQVLRSDCLANATMTFV